MVKKKAAALTATALASLAGCTFAFPVTVREGPEDGGAGDVRVAEAGSFEAAADAWVADADAAPGFFCASVDPGDSSFFRCFDYDSPDAALAAPAAMPRSSVGIATDAAFSAPNSLFAQTPILADGALGGAVDNVVVFPANAQTKSLDFRFDMRVEPTTGGFPALVVANNGPWRFYVNIEPGANPAVRILEANNVGPPQTHNGAFVIKFGTWHRYEGSISVVTSTFSLSVDGTPFYKNEALQFKPAPTGFRTALGVEYVQGPYPAIAVNFDNVVLRAAF